MASAVLTLVSIYLAENNGVRHIASSLRRHGHRVYEIYFKDYLHHRFITPTDREVAGLLRVLRETGTTLVGLSLRAGAYLPVARALTQRIREELNIPILWGGMHVTMAPEECIADADLICRGEGEAPMVDLMGRLAADLPITDLPNFWIRTPQGITRNPIRPQENNLDDLPFRDFHSHEFKYVISGRHVTHGDPLVMEPVYQIMASRGCYFDCHYCDINALRTIHGEGGFSYRVRSVDNLLRELIYAKQEFPGLKRIRFDDELFVSDREWVRDFSTRYRREVNLPFEVLIDPRVVNREGLGLLKDAGLDTVLMGIQNTERINREIYNRPISNQRILETARLISSLGLKACYQLMVDDPVSTTADKEELFRMLLQLPLPYDLYLFSLCLWPGTALIQTLKDRGLITDQEVEGHNHKVLHQFRVDLNWPRPPEDKYWISLIMLLSSHLVPRGILSRLANNLWLRRHPGPLVIWPRGPISAN